MRISDWSSDVCSSDLHIPPRHGNAEHHHASAGLPAMYRTFMPECGPAGIAVGMEGNVSYCWDAGQCRLRYAWKGGFVNLEKNWHSNGSKKAELVGEVRSEEHTSELQSLMRISYDVFCLQKKKKY